MGNKVEIIIEETGKNTVDVKAYLNGHHLKNVFGLDMDVNMRENKVSFNGKRLSLDKGGQYFVDPETKDTATEDVNMLLYFKPEFRIREKTDHMMMAVEAICRNIRATSVVNARKLISERLGG